MADENSLLNTVRRDDRQLQGVAGAGERQARMAAGHARKARSALCAAKGSERLIAFHNLTAEPHVIPFAEWQVCCDAFDPESELGEYITLPPYGYRWLVPITECQIGSISPGRSALRPGD